MNYSDPTYDEMYDYLARNWGDMEYDIPFAIYYFAVDHHSWVGARPETPNLIAAETISGVRLGPMSRLENEDEIIQDMYDDLVDAYA